MCSALNVLSCASAPASRKRRPKTDRDDLGVPHDGVRQREGQDDLDLERGDVAVCSDVVHRVQQPEVAVRWFACGPGWKRSDGSSEEWARGLTAFLDDVQARVGDVVVLELLALLKGTDQYGVVLGRDERDCVETEWWRH